MQNNHSQCLDNSGDCPNAAVEDRARLRKQIRLARLRLLKADQELAILRNSTSWQLTAPFRHFMQRHPKPGFLVHKALRLSVHFYRGELIALLRCRWRALQQPRLTRPEPLTAGATALSSMLPFPSLSDPHGHTILVVDYSVPLIDQFAGARVTFCFLSLLQKEGWSVTFWPFGRANRGAYTRNVEALGISVIDERYHGSLEDWLEEHGHKLEHVMLMRPEIAGNLLPIVLRYTDARLSYYGHDLHHVRFRQEGRISRDPDALETATLLEAEERRIWRAVDVVLYPSVEEIQEVMRLEPDVEAYALPLYAFDSFPVPPQPTSGETMLFVGGFRHSPNVDAVCWFVKAILPRVLARRPRARAVIAGASPPEAVRALAGPNVLVTGQISEPELAGWYERARVSVAPLRFGAGVKGKVIEALHAGLPLVTTTAGAQGLPGLSLIVPVHDDPEEQADAILRLLTDDVAWCAQSEAQIAYSRSHFSYTALRKQLLSALLGA